jgi:hypothetical protein
VAETPSHSTLPGAAIADLAADPSVLEVSPRFEPVREVVKKTRNLTAGTDKVRIIPFAVDPDVLPDGRESGAGKISHEAYLRPHPDLPHATVVTLPWNFRRARATR